LPGAANSHLLDSLLELQALDRLPRVGFSLRGVVAPETISEHLFHLSFLVWAVARQEVGIELGRALEIALLHDLAEVRLGDLPRTAAFYLPAGVKAAAERAILADVLAPLPGAAETLADYQQGASREARLVAVCDKLQLVIKAFSYRRAGNPSMDEFFAGLESFDDGGFALVRQLVDELKRRLPASGAA
jgi:putative hydrolase of HD superfamily